MQNLPVPFDRRVWLECQSLRAAGFQVSVVCPKGPGDPATRCSTASDLYGTRPRRRTQAMLSLPYEFAYCWLRTATLWLALTVRRRSGFDVIQACNPPDTFWALALPFKLAGMRFVFDQHDLCPEVYESRFPDGSRGCSHRGLPAARAGHVRDRRPRDLDERVVPRDRASGGAGGDADDVTVVRTGPGPGAASARRAGSRAPRAGAATCAPTSASWARRTASISRSAPLPTRRTAGRDDIQFVFMGNGDSLDELQQLAARARPRPTS